MHEVTEEMRAAWAAETAKRDEAGTQALIAQLRDSDDDRLRKVADQYDKGLLAFFELEYKVREILGDRG